MNFGQTILEPSYTRMPDFDSIDSNHASFEFDCKNCKSSIVRPYRELIANTNWCDDFDKTTIDEISQFYEMNLVGKAPDGGWTAVEKYQCNNCGTRYLIYAGVNEYANSVYRVTLQGITELLDDRN